MRDFLADDHVFDPGAVSILMAAFDSAWQSIKASGGRLSEEQSDLVRATLAKYIIDQARQGELDEVRLRDGALAFFTFCSVCDRLFRRGEGRATNWSINSMQCLQTSDFTSFRASWINDRSRRRCSLASAVKWPWR